MNVSLLISLVLQRTAHPKGSNNKVPGAEYAGVLISQAATTTEWVGGWGLILLMCSNEGARGPGRKLLECGRWKRAPLIWQQSTTGPRGATESFVTRTRTFLLLSARACIAAPANNDKANERRRLMLQRQFLRPLQLLRLFAIRPLVCIRLRKQEMRRPTL